MEKRAYNYKMTLEGLANSKGEKLENDPIEIQFQNHDDLFKILEMIKARPLFENSNDDKEFFIGLKLFSEVLLRNRKNENELTKDLSAAVGEFMKKIKSR